MHRSEGASALLGMEEFVVAARKEIDREVWLAVETIPEVVSCDGCRTRAVGNGRRVMRVRDVPMHHCSAAASNGRTRPAALMRGRHSAWSRRAP